MTNTNCIIETIYSILRYNKIPDEIIIKIVYTHNAIEHPCSTIFTEYYLKKNKFNLGCSCIWININKLDPLLGYRSGIDWEIITCDICSYFKNNFNEGIIDEYQEWVEELYECDNCGNISYNSECVC